MNGSVTHRTHRWILLAAAAIVAMLSAVTPAMGQFGAGAYGTLVWDPDKQCWIMIDRNGFARRLVDEDVQRVPLRGAQPLLIVERHPFTLFNDDSGNVSGYAKLDGVARETFGDEFVNTLHQGGAILTNTPIIGADGAIQGYEIIPPTHLPDGTQLSPGARAFIGDYMNEPEGYGDVGSGDRSGYGDAEVYVPGADFFREDQSGVRSSVHVAGMGTIYLTNDGNSCTIYQHGGADVGNFPTTTHWPGVGSDTEYGYPGNAGPITHMHYHMNTVTGNVDYIQLDLANGGHFRLDGSSGTGLYFDPFNPGAPPPNQPYAGLRPDKNKPGAWVQPRRKDPPPKKKKDPAPPVPNPITQKDMDDFQAQLGAKWELSFKTGTQWHNRFLNDSDFDFGPVDEEPQFGVVPSINVKFLGPDRLSDAERQNITDSANELDQLGDDIAQRRHNSQVQFQLIEGQQQIEDLLYNRTVKTADEARAIAVDVVKKQFEAGLGLLLANSDKIKGKWEKMPDGPAKDKLGKIFRSDSWEAFLAGGKESAASGVLKTYQAFGGTYLEGLGAGVMEALPDKAQQAIGQMQAAYKLSQAASGLITSTWDLEALESMGDDIDRARQNWWHYNQDTRDMIAHQQGLAGQIVDLTDAAVRGVNGMDRVRFINSVINEVRSHSGGVDVSDEIGRLQTLRDDTVIYLPGGEWGTEPVLYSRLYKVANASARIQMLYDDEMARKYPELWAAMQQTKAENALRQFQRAAHGAKSDGKKVQPGKDTTAPKPKDDDDDTPPGPITLPGGGTATLPGGSGGPLQMPDGTQVYTYPAGSRIERVFVMPPDASGRSATVTHYAGGLVAVVQADGTRVEFDSNTGNNKTVLPDGTVVLKGPDGKRIVETDSKRLLLIPEGALQINPGAGNDILTLDDATSVDDALMPDMGSDLGYIIVDDPVVGPEDFLLLESAPLE